MPACGQLERSDLLPPFDVPLGAVIGDGNDREEDQRYHHEGGKTYRER